MAAWSELPEEIIYRIFKFLNATVDCTPFRSVCTSWRSSTDSCVHSFPDPVVILPSNMSPNLSAPFHLSKHKIYLVRSLNKARIIKVLETDSRRKLLSPMSRLKAMSVAPVTPLVWDMIDLRVFELGQEYVLYQSPDPNLSSSAIHNLYREKVVVVWDSSGSGFSMLTVHVSGKLILFRSHDQTWSVIEFFSSPYDDVIAFKGNFYAVDGTGRLIRVGPGGELDLVANPIFGGDQKHLIASSDGLLLVDAYTSVGIDDESIDLSLFTENQSSHMVERAVSFKIYKMDEKKQSWDEFNSLDDQVLFLGSDCAFSASADDLFWRKGNCILFVEHLACCQKGSNNEENAGSFAYEDIFVYDLHNGCVEPLRNFPEYLDIFSPFPP